MSDNFNPQITGLASFICGLMISIVLFIGTKEEEIFKVSNSLKICLISLLALLLVFFIKSYYTLIIANPLNYEHADMLPVIKVMCRRWINGEEVYKIIPEIWGGMKPIYLPAMWLPFVIPEIFNVDIRISCIIFMTSPIILFVILNYKRVNLYVLLLFIFSFLILFLYLLNKGKNILILTEEGVIYGYYSLLALAIYYKKPYLIGLVLSLCLLSRYMIIGWALAYLMYSLFHIKNNKKVLISFVASFLVLIVITDSFLEIKNFISLPASYLKSIQQNPIKYEESIEEVRHSFSYLFYPANLNILQYLGISLNLLIPLIFIVQGSKNILMNLAVIKLVIVVFFSTIIMPYGYLNYTSLYFSVFTVGCYLIKQNL